ncbi:MAG: hypothetical protein DMF67_01225 [Acidobacteria bacterium]|nr:MAG: hypothetical protein DMF66_05475 [Acidobacteriota bacterium]PYS85316.1 MAG: hypothetical protein DMF67_01225 [Acidobacteriota bacterium]
MRVLEESLPREDEFEELAEHELSGAHAATQRFTPEQLIACERCLRANAPTRMNCLYCGAALPSTAQSTALRRPVLKKLEEWEQGFNVVLLPRAGRELTPEEVGVAASLLRLDAARLVEIVEARRALPLARASSVAEGELILKRLGALGLAAEVFADDELLRQPARIRALTLGEDALVCWPTLDAEPRRVAWSEVFLLVRGRVVTKRVEVEERRGQLKGRSEIVEVREIASDEAVLDIHAAAETGDECFRVMADNFDYSCLGADKRLLARENFVTLVETLRARAPSAAFDDEYVSSRALLSAAWPPAERTESLGLRRERPGRLNTEAATVVTNEAQFTRYSRLRRRLALRGRG